MPARPLAVLFDLDGTLIDTVELLLDSVRHAFRGHPGRVPTDAEWVAGIGTPLVTQLRPYAADADELAALIAGYRAYQREHHDRLTRPFPGALETVAALRSRGHPLAIVTSKGDDIALHSLAHVGLASSMDVVIGCDSCNRHKPDPEPVHVALERLGYAADEALFVGDSPHDVAAGRAAGTRTAAALWGPFSPETLHAAGPDAFLREQRDVLRLLNGGD